MTVWPIVIGMGVVTYSTLKGVVAAGRFYSKEYLDKAISRHRERFERSAHEAIPLAFIRLSLMNFDNQNR